MLTDNIAVRGTTLPVTQRGSGSTLTVRSKVILAQTIASHSYAVSRSLSIGQQSTREGTRTLIRFDEKAKPTDTTGLPLNVASQLVLIGSDAPASTAYAAASALTDLLTALIGSAEDNGSGNFIGTSIPSTTDLGDLTGLQCLEMLQGQVERIVGGED